VSRPGRRLSPAEAALWAQIASTVTPIEPRKVKAKAPVAQPPAPEPRPEPSFAEAIKQPPAKLAKKRAAAPAPQRHAPPVPRAPDGAKLGLDAGWDRKLARGTVQPDFSLDLHGATLDAAYSRLLHGLTQAKAMDARVVLVVTGKARPVHAADRGDRRGAIRAKIVDWLAASEHASDIAAIRNAHRKHGGEGALYVILKRRR
jgi:DNA-nicking Smr family endonuclease